MSRMKPLFKKVTHCIFDLDGLLIDSEKAYAETYSKIAKSFGKEYTREIKAKVSGTSTQRGAEIQIREMGLPITVEDFLERYKIITKQLLANVQLMPGAQRLVCHLRDHNVPVSLATSSPEDDFMFKTRNHQEFFSLFHPRVFGGSDPTVTVPKPAPCIFLISTERFCEPPSDPSDVLVFEDSPNGVLAANAACMQVVMVPDPDTPKEMTSTATQVLKSLEDFKPEDFGLPPYK